MNNNYINIPTDPNHRIIPQMGKQKWKKQKRQWGNNRENEKERQSNQLHRRKLCKHASNAWKPKNLCVLFSPLAFWGSGSRCACFIKVIRRTVFRNNCSRCWLYLYFDRYMFRPLSAIFRQNTQYIKKLLLQQQIGCILYKSYCILFFGKYCLRLIKRECEVSNCECNHLVFNIKMLKCGC
jgi:hypothetical protein